MTQDKFKTYGNVFDNYTHKNLFRMMSQGLFEGLESPISIGKEANIFTAKKKDGGTVIVKIYRLETCDFNRMFDYIRTDPRIVKIRRSKRNIIFEWTRREYVNLHKAREAGVRVPIPMAVRDNIIVMEKIGNNCISPKVKDSYPDMEQFSKRVIGFMKKLYSARIVHGDLSEFNILDLEGNPVFIDFSQATSIDDPHAHAYLIRDAKNMSRFFAKRDVAISPEELVLRVIT